MALLLAAGATAQAQKPQAPNAPNWEQVITPLGAGFESSWVGGWIKIQSQHPLNCSTDAANVIYTQTRAVGASGDVDWARWRPTIPATTLYDVYVYIPDYPHTMNVTGQARYKIAYDGGEATIVINQNNNKCTWVGLGQYQFAAGTSGYVYMGDWTGDNPVRLIAADGVKFVQAAPPPTTVVVDDGDAGFSQSAGWTLATGNWSRGCSGNAGDARWTYSRRPGYTNIVDWATWTSNLPQAGSYEVFIQVPGIDNGLSDTQHAYYQVQAANGVSTVERSQRNNWCQWISLGTFYFNAGTGGWVSLGDYTGGESPNTSVVADAVKWEYRGSTPPPPPTPTPTPPPPPVTNIVSAARAEIGMLYPASGTSRGGSRASGPFGPWHYPQGVCTDVVIDSYVAGGLANWLWTQFYRNSETMRTYFRNNQIYLTNDQPWQVGDIMFVGKNNHAWHVGIVVEVNAQGRPTKFVHNGTPGKTAVERTMFFNGWCCGYSVLGHGRLKSAQAMLLSPSAVMTATRELQITLDTSSQTAAQVYLYDSEGRFVSRLFDIGFPASSDPDFDPYMINGDYDNTSTSQQITLSDPADGNYRIEVVGATTSPYTLKAQVLQDGLVVSEQTYTGNAVSGQTLVSDVAVSGTGASMTSTAPSLSVALNVPDVIEVNGTSGSFTISETTGLGAISGVSFEVSDLTAPLLDSVSGAMNFAPSSTSISANGQQTIAFTVPPQILLPGESYLGSIIVRTNNAGTRRIPVVLTSKAVFLPIVIR